MIFFLICEFMDRQILQKDINYVKFYYRFNIFWKKWKQKQEIITVQFLYAYCIHNEDWRDYETK